MASFSESKTAPCLIQLALPVSKGGEHVDPQLEINLEPVYDQTHRMAANTLTERPFIHKLGQTAQFADKFWQLNREIAPGL